MNDKGRLIIFPSNLELPVKGLRNPTEDFRCTAVYEAIVRRYQERSKDEWFRNMEGLSHYRNMVLD